MKKNKKNKSKVSMTNVDYDSNVDNKFKAVISLGKDIKATEIVDIDVKSLDHKELLYDDVADAFLVILEKKYPESDFPNATIESYEVFCKEDQRWYPMFAESEKDKIKTADKSKHIKFLVLPEATYALTPECKLWLTMKKYGLISEDEPFDYEKIHSLIEIAKKD